MTSLMLALGTEKGLFLAWSDPDRHNWQLDGPKLKGWKVHHVLLDIRAEPRLYAAVSSFIYGPGLHVSHDFGETWRELPNPPQYPKDASHSVNAIWTLAPGPKDEPQTLYAGVDEAGLFVSRDGGEHWEEMPGLSRHATREEWQPGAGGLCCHSVLQHPGNPKRLWVGISAVGVFRSDDGGTTWQAKNEGLEIVIPGKTHPDIGTCVHHLELDPENPERLFQQNHKGVFRSTDGGDTWQRIETGLAQRFGFPLAVHPKQPSTLFIVPQESDEYRIVPAGKLTVFRSTDAGETWQPLRRGLPDQSYTGVLRQAMAADGQDGVYFGTTGGQVFFSRDNGDQWQALPCHLPRIYAVAVHSVER